MRKLIVLLFAVVLVVGCADGGAALRDALLQDMMHGMDWVGDGSMDSDTAYAIEKYQVTTRPYTSYHTRGSYPTYNFYHGGRR